MEPSKTIADTLAAAVTAAGTAVNPTVAYVTDKLGAGLTALKVPAAQVWGILITQATVRGWANLGLCALILGLWLVMWRQVPKLAAYEKRESDSRDCLGTCIATGIFGLITVIFFVCCLWEGVLMTLNPEYYALREILRVF